MSNKESPLRTPIFVLPVQVGASGMQGWRRGMEDAHTCVLDVGGGRRCAFFGVFDGHCGQNTARFCGDNLERQVVAKVCLTYHLWLAKVKR